MTTTNTKINLPTGTFLDAMNSCREIAGSFKDEVIAQKFVGDITSLLASRGTDLVGTTALDKERLRTMLDSGADFAELLEKKGMYHNAAAVAFDLQTMFTFKDESWAPSLNRLYRLWTRHIRQL